MSRLVRYETVPLARGPTAFGASEDKATKEADGYISKLAKYVPAEMIAIATGFFAAFSVDGAMVWFLVGLGVVLNVVYLYTLGVKSDEESSAPPKYFYVLSGLAFVLWAASTIDAVAAESMLSSEVQRAFILALAAFLVPLLDTLCGVIAKRGQ